MLLGMAMGTGFLLVVAYVLIHGDQKLVGDQIEYDLQGRFFSDGHPWWSTTPFGIAHASALKAPLYPAWVGSWYTLFGDSPTTVELIQSLLAPLTIFMTWLLARRLFDPRVAIASAWAVAVFPLAWEPYGLLYSEALAIPLTVGILLATLDHTPTARRAGLVGAAMGVSLLLRPSSSFLIVGVAACWLVGAGWRRGAALTALTVGCAILVVLPWTVRNYVITDGGIIPISTQDAGTLIGTFNAESANDPEFPYAWRLNAAVERRIYDPSHPVDDAELRRKLLAAARRYIEDHPTAVLEAFFWNGLSRFWDVRRPARALHEVPLSGRSRGLAIAGLAIYYVLLPLAVLALWRFRRRREIVFPVVALAVAASVVFTVEAATRYRGPLEPLIVVLACAALLGETAAFTRSPRRAQ